ncbi:unnamed protein product [Aphanomyces euteiches]
MPRRSRSRSFSRRAFVEVLVETVLDAAEVLATAEIAAVVAAEVDRALQDGNKRQSEKKDDEGKTNRSPSPDDGASLHVANLTRNVNSEHLEEIFGKFGGVADVTLEVDKESKLSKGTAYIRFHKRDEAETAQLHMHEGQIDGNKIQVNFVLVQPKPKRSVSPKSSTGAIRRRSPPNTRRKPSPFRPRSRSPAHPEDEDLLPFDEEVDLHFHEEGVALPVVHLRSIRGIEDLVRVLVLLIVDHVLVLHVVVAAVH